MMAAGVAAEVDSNVHQPVGGLDSGQVGAREIREAKDVITIIPERPRARASTAPRAAESPTREGEPKACETA